MAGQVGNADGDVGFQIAPMVDVVFVLVLFFMASAGMQQTELELGVTLPSIGAPGSENVSETTPIFVEIDARGQVTVNGQSFDTPTAEEMPQLTAYLATLMQETGGRDPVFIRPDLQTRHARVVSVLNAAGKAGVKTLTFS
jgi:biopolymer transport protein ExbD